MTSEFNRHDLYNSADPDSIYCSSFSKFFDYESDPKMKTNGFKQNMQEWSQNRRLYSLFPECLHLPCPVYPGPPHRCGKLRRHWLQLPDRGRWQCLRGPWLAQSGSVPKRPKFQK
uniref:(northern house mosquito) hypothetical protein n=1 Tax=Culex pipiens TaxID=7175 RepID=A0A8D8A2J9_CULPI